MLEVRPISKPRTLLHWYQEKHIIDMDPSYQRRGDIWPERNKQLLINSILNCYDIPKIYLADFTYTNTQLKEEKKPYAVIDGKQRLTIFFAFFDGKLRLGDTPIFYKGTELRLAGLSYSDLKSKQPLLAKQFEDFVPTVMSVISDQLEEVQELFIRLNLNVSVSGPERRNAMPGPIPPLIRKLSVHEVFRKRASFPINRGQDLNAAAKILLMEYRQGFTNTKKIDLDRFVQTNKDKSASNFGHIFKAADETLRIMTEIFEEKDKLLKSQTQLSVFYWLVKNHAGRYKKKIRTCLERIEKDRARVRSESAARAKGANVQISDIKLLDYNRFVRTPDDKSKQEFMYKLLEERLRRYQ